MTELILGVYGALCVVATIAFIAWGFATRRNAGSNVAEMMEEFEEFVGDRRSDFDVQPAELANSARGLGEPKPRRVGSPFAAQSKATSAT